LRIDGVIGGLFDSGGEKVDGVKYSVFVGNAGRSEVVMPKFNCVGDDKSFGVRVYYFEATIVGESWPDVEAISASEGPRCPLVGFVVNDDRAATGADGCGIKVEGGLVVEFPGRHVRGDG
jgi:hypothetical protein